MPELPEVETTVRALRNAKPPIMGASFLDVWTDTPKILRFDPEDLIGLRVLEIGRRGKNILFSLNEDTLLVHQKMSGHLLYGDYKDDPYVRVKLYLDNGETLALSDLRKFAKMELGEVDLDLGPGALSLSLGELKEIFRGRSARIKNLLLNQSWLAGIGNIYSDEILWRSKIHPLRKADTLTEGEREALYKNIVDVLEEAIKRKGTSTSDYRTLSGERGEYQNELDVYDREGEECHECGSVIERIRVSGRSARICPSCQKL